MTLRNETPLAEGLDHRDIARVSLRAVQAFVCVVDHASFTEAAHSLYLDPSTVSKLVQRLEAALGVQLLRRSTRRVLLTGHGESMLPIARRLLTDCHALIALAQ